MVRRGLNQRDLCAMHNMLSTVFFSYAFLLCSFLLYCFAGDTITNAGNLIIHDGGETLVSAGKRFELAGAEEGASRGPGPAIHFNFL